MINNYCTILSKESLYQGLILYDSLKKYNKYFYWFVLCLQEEVKDILDKMNLENTILVSSEELESYDQELLTVKAQRNQKEYAWTIKSPLILYLFDKYSFIDHLVYIDGDTEFFHNPNPIFEELKDSSIMLTRERFYIQDNEFWYREYGQYNGGFMAFTRDENAFLALRWLRKRCLEWCYNRLENNLYGDQKYTVDWTERFQGVKVPTHMGINVTAWYSHACDLEVSDNTININTQPIIFYHYNGFGIFNYSEFELCIFMKLPRRLVSLIYVPYIEKLQKVISLVAQYDDSFYDSVAKTTTDQHINNYYQSSKTFTPSELVSYEDYNYCTLIGKDYIIKGLSMYNSLLDTHDSFHLWVCCMDEDSFNILSALELKNITLIPVSTIEDSSLLAVKSTRSSGEYCWSMKAHWMLYLLDNFSYLSKLVFIDGDLFFFEKADYVFKQLTSCSVLLCPQRDKQWVEEQFGKYQAGFIGVKNDSQAKEALSWWRERCLEWCSSEQGHKDKWGDQKYLDKLPELFENVKLCDNPGVNTALWYAKDNLSISANKAYINGHQLICYHYCNMVIFNEREYDLWKWPNWHVDMQLLEYVYKPYISKIFDVITYLKSVNLDVRSLLKDDTDEKLVYNYYQYPRKK